MKHTDIKQVLECAEFLGKEVTGDKKYYNSHLTRYPYKCWDKEL